MAKHVISEPYTFSPSSRTVTVNGKAIQRERLILILNVTTNTIIYNFSDPSLGATSYTTSTANNIESTTIILTYNTGSMDLAHKLSIIVDEVNESFMPADFMLDSNTKLRVSQPQSLIDTDFEYGTQPTKWETISVMNNRPSAFYDNTSPITLTGINGATSSRTITVTYSGTPNVTPVAVTTPIYVQDSTDYNANGWYLVQTTGAGTFTYTARATRPDNNSIFDTTKTYIWMGVFYSGSAITVSASAGAAFTYSSTTITCTTTYNHGLSVGDGIYVLGTTGATNNPNGAWQVVKTPTSSTFTFEAALAPTTGTITAAAGAALTLYARPWGNAIHRPFDGGVYFTAGAPYHGNQLIRQTRRYFRYQSGKGMMFSTGSCFTSPFIVDLMTNGGSGTTVTITTKFPHNLWIGSILRVSGADQSQYNGVWTVVTVPSEISLTITVSSAPTVAPATGNFTVQPNSWTGAYIRVGMFDNQNGFFWEFDGQGLYVVRRSSTTQLSGYVSALTAGAQSATGSGTLWASQLNPGDQIVIRGMSYTVVSIESQTSITIYPEYRGNTISTPTQCIISRTDNLRIPQSSWNIDKLDGTGISGYTVDINKMQMWMIDYSWYGAGAIRWGVKNARGDFVYCHRLAHANTMTEAYMRSGNMPARYEVNTIAPFTKLALSNLTIGETSVMNVTSTTGFPSSGTLVVAASGNTGAAIEYITYGSKTTTTFNSLTRGVQTLTGPLGLSLGGGSGATAFTYSATAPVSITYFSPQCSNTISHWGSSVIMDGRYDDDKSIQFNYGMTTGVTYATAGQRYPVFSVRLAPSVDSGITGILGARELINRMQLQPVGMGVYATTSGVRVELWLNAQVSAGTFGPVGGSSLAQFSLHANTATMSGGESIFTFIAPAGGVSTQDLSKMRDIGNSVLGGGTSNNYPTGYNNKYPDGPDILTVAVIPLSASPVVIARMSWTEAQA